MFTTIAFKKLVVHNDRLRSTRCASNASRIRLMRQRSSNRGILIARACKKILRAELLFLGDAIDPQVMGCVFPSGKLVNRDGLLSTIIAIAGDRPLTVHDIIDFEAHIAGGVHFGSPESDMERAVASLSALYLMRGRRPSLEELRGIGRVVLRAIGPLRQAIERPVGV